MVVRFISGLADPTCLPKFYAIDFRIGKTKSRYFVDKAGDEAALILERIDKRWSLVGPSRSKY
jgi:hypothetical protein